LTKVSCYEGVTLVSYLAREITRSLVDELALKDNVDDVGAWTTL